MFSQLHACFFPLRVLLLLPLRGLTSLSRTSIHIFLNKNLKDHHWGKQVFLLCIYMCFCEGLGYILTTWDYSSLSLLCVCMHWLVEYVHMFRCVCTQMHLHVEAWGWGWVPFLDCFPQVFHWTQGHQLVRLAAHQLPPPPICLSLCLLEQGLEAYTTTLVIRTQILMLER